MTGIDQPTAAEALRRLEPLVGTWGLEARATSWSATGTAEMAWDESGRLLRVRSTMDLPEAPTTASVIGCDAANGTYTQLYTDERGVCRVYEMGLEGRTWTLARQGEPFAQRFTGTISEDGYTIAGRWDLAEDGSTFTPDFELIYRRITGS
jgi:hypothetical protein